MLSTEQQAINYTNLSVMTEYNKTQ